MQRLDKCKGFFEGTADAGMCGHCGKACAAYLEFLGEGSPSLATHQAALLPGAF